MTHSIERPAPEATKQSYTNGVKVEEIKKKQILDEISKDIRNLHAIAIPNI